VVGTQFAHPTGEILDSEQRFKIDLEGARVRGRLDRLDRLPNGEVAIIDYKTGKAKTQEDADDSLQLSIYALAAKALGHAPSSLVFVI
jgi:RecB family exonuclease